MQRRKVVENIADLRAHLGRVYPAHALLEFIERDSAFVLRGFKPFDVGLALRM